MIKDLEKISNEISRSQIGWKGTFRDFLQIIDDKFNKDQESGTKSSAYKNVGVLAHTRVANMIHSSGLKDSDYYGTSRKSYLFFEDSLFGIEKSIDDIMNYINAAAQRTETARRMLLLYGPPSSGKSEISTLIKRGLERYTRTEEGAIFALSGSQMYENPLLLIPNDLRDDFTKKYGIHIEGELSPSSKWRLDNEFDGKFMNFPIEQIFISETNRVGVGTFVPSDPKSMDQAELVGSIDLAKIQDIGKESDPQAYNFDGELNVANRGIMEFVEGLKCDERFLRVLLTASQEKVIKAPRFGLIYVDTFLIIHTNETEFKSFMAEKKYEAYHDRMVIVKVPYNLGVGNEVKIYQKLLDRSDAIANIHIAPHTLEAAAMFSVMTRMEPPTDDLTITKKMKLYDCQHVKGHKIEQVPAIRKKCPREGMFGVSPRFVIDQISASISVAKDEGRDFITPLDVLRQLNRGLRGRDSFSPEEKNKYEEFIDIARSEWNDMLRNDIQKAFFLSFEEEARNLCDNYIDQIEASCAKQKIKDPVTGEEKEPDEKLMDEIEDHLDISSSGKEDFRNEVLRSVGSAARKGKKFDYTQHSQLREAIQTQLFIERQGTIRMTVSTRNPDPEALRRLNDVIDRMVDQQGYSAASANELLKYATAHLFDK